jgi:hypothetical protein
MHGSPIWERTMMRRFVCTVAAAMLTLCLTAYAHAAEYGTAEEAKAMLERAVAAVKEDKPKALDMFQKGEGGFKDRDLYVWCANASDSILTAHPTNKGKGLRYIEGKHGAPFGQEICSTPPKERLKRLLTGGRALAQTNRWRRLPFTRRSEIRFAVSATTSELHNWVDADSLAITCFSSSGPTERSPVNGRLYAAINSKDSAMPVAKRVNAIAQVRRLSL